MAGAGAQAAAIAFFLVNANDFPNHFDPSFGLKCSIQESSRKICILGYTARDFWFIMAIRKSKGGI
jgi:hypothetical protein